MAYAIHWKIKFRVLHSNQLLTVNVWKDGALPTGYPLTLTGAQAPFSTHEDDNEELFQPIRTQSGYLRIVDDGTAVNSNSTVVSFNWKDLLPNTDTDRPVTLTDASDSVLWQGFMQAQNFSGSLYGGTQVREFPVQCVVTALSSADVDTTNTEIKNFAHVIKSSFDALTNTVIDISNYVFQGDTYALQWLQKKVDWQNFMAQDADGNLTGRYDLQTILMDVCRFWGWTVRTYGRDVIFTRPDNNELNKFVSLTKAQMATLAAEGSVSVSATTAPSVTPSGDIFASTNINDFRNRGANKATVAADANSNDTIVEFAPTSLQETWNQDTVTDTEDYGDVEVEYKDIASFPDSGRISPFVSGTAATGQGGSFAAATIEKGTGAQLTSEEEKYVMRFTKSYNGNTMLSLQSVFQHSLSNGTLRMYGIIYSAGEKLVSTDRWGTPTEYTMVMKLGIGLTRSSARWWNGQAWQSTETTFVAGICSDDGLIWTTFTHGGHSGRAYRPKIATEQGMAGCVFLEFLGSENLPDRSGQRKFFIDGFSVTFQTPDSRNLEKPKGGMSEQREYVAKNQYMTRSEWNCDTIYASQNWLNFGYGVVMNSDYTLMESANFGASLTMLPEQHLANRVVNFWATAKRMIRADLWNSDSVIGAITPKHYVTLDGTRLHPIAISHEWRDNVVTLALLEIPTEL